MTRDDTIAIDLLLLHAKVSAAVSHQLIVLDEGALVEQKFNSLTRRKLVVSMLLVNTGLTTAHKSFFLNAVEALSKRLLLERRERLKLGEGHRIHHRHPELVESKRHHRPMHRMGESWEHPDSS